MQVQSKISLMMGTHFTDRAKPMPTAKQEVPTRNFASGAKRGAGDSHGLSAFPHFRGKRFLLGEVVCPPIDRRDSIRDGGLSGPGGRCVFNRESPRTRARSGRKCEYAFPFSNVPRSHSAVIAAWDDAVGKPFRYCSCARAILGMVEIYNWKFPVMKSGFFPQDQPARARRIISTPGRSFADLPM